MDAFLRTLEDFLQHLRWWPIAALGLGCCALTIFFCLLAFPGKQGAPDPDAAFQAETLSAAAPAETAEPAAIRAFDPDSGQVVALDLETYILGVVAAEMPASYEPEALKAQAVASRTYLMQKIASGAGCSRHPDADICLESSHCQAYQSETQRKTRWCDEFDRYEQKLADAVQQTAGLCLLFDGEPIRALYHAVSGGETEDVVSVFNMDLPYLKSVQSPGEENASHFETVVSIKRGDAAAKLKTFSAGVSSSSLQKQIEILSRSETGRVLSVRVGSATVTGREFRGALGLDSTNFTLKFTKTFLIVSTRGYGHGVGMSQAGAQAMAENGASFSEILLHYYSGVALAEYAAS